MKTLYKATLLALGTQILACGAHPGFLHEASTDGSSVSGVGGGSLDSRKIDYEEPLIRERVAPENEKKSAYVLYAVDTAELRFTGTMAHELLALKESCDGRKDVNWVAFVNSVYLVKQQFFKCLEGKFSVESYTVKDLAAKVAAIQDPAFDTQLKNKDDKRTALFNPAFALQHGKDLNKYYKDVPMAHPEILSTIMTYVMTDIFKPQDYVYTWHFKGHGGTEFALTGLNEEQMLRKQKVQQDEAKSLNLTQLLKLKYGEAGYKVNLFLEAELQKLGLGQLQARTSLASLQRLLGTEGSQALGTEGSQALGTEGNQALGVEGSQALGVDGQGLKAENFFGTPKKLFYSVLGAAVKRAEEVTKGRVEIGFLFAESCISDVRSQMLDTLALRPALKAMYSPSGSVMYRNIDMNNIFTAWQAQKPTAESFQQLMIQATAKIRNYEGR